MKTEKYSIVSSKQIFIKTYNKNPIEISND